MKYIIILQTIIGIIYLIRRGEVNKHNEET